MSKPVAGDAMASLSVMVIRGTSIPFVRELTSSMAELCAVAPVLLMATLCADALPAATDAVNKHKDLSSFI
jgi:hypothetical protein